MTGRTQTLPWWLGGVGVQTTEKKYTFTPLTVPPYGNCLLLEDKIRVGYLGTTYLNTVSTSQHRFPFRLYAR